MTRPDTIERPVTAERPDTARDERPRASLSRDVRWLDRPYDEVHDAALDSFPASDPPSWSPIRVGAPATRESPAPATPGS